MMDCCQEYTRVSRRSLLKASTLTASSTAVTTLVGDCFISTAYGATVSNTLVVLSLRGGADGLSLVVPHGEANYYKARPSIAVAKEQLWGQDEMFGLHPALQPLQKYWDEKKLAVVHAVGQLTPNRSHFSAMEEIEDADPGSRERIGWLNRLVGDLAEQDQLAALQYGSNTLATQLAGPAPALAVGAPEMIAFPGNRSEDDLARKAALASLWGRETSSLKAVFKAAVEAEKTYSAVRAIKPQVTYPKTDLGKALASVASTVKANVGARVITIDCGSWDHHVWVGDVQDGNLKRRATELAQALAAFFEDLGEAASKTTLVTVSEFGRRLQQNSNSGLDHGWGNVMFVFDSQMYGGKVYGQWPGLTLGSDEDLSATTDYRSVLAEIVNKRFSASVASVFPAYVYTPLNILKA